MLKFYVKAREAVEGLRMDKDGVVSFEYVIVACCIVGAVIAVFGSGSGGQIGLALQSAITKVTTAINGLTV